MRNNLLLLSSDKFKGVVDGGGEFLRVVGYYDEGLLRVVAEGLYYLHNQGAVLAVKSVKRFVQDE